MSSVLIVDDEPGMRELLKRWLALAGYKTSEAPDAETALNLVARSTPDVVLCDVIIPGHDGLWLTQQLRERFPTVAVVLATAVDTVSPTVSLRRGVAEYLVKPFERGHVLAAVSRAVEWHQTELARGSERTTTTDPIEWFSGAGQRTQHGSRPSPEVTGSEAPTECEPAMIDNDKCRHDFKNQLGVILGFAGILLAEAADGDPRRGDFEEIHKAAATALDLLTRLFPAHTVTP